MCSNILVFLHASNVIANMHLSYCNRTSITLMDDTWSVRIMVVSHTTNQPVLCYPAALAGLPVIIPHYLECDTRQSQGTHQVSGCSCLKTVFVDSTSLLVVVYIYRHCTTPDHQECCPGCGLRQSNCSVAECPGTNVN